jgi:GAF domain-containing protein
LVAAAVDTTDAAHGWLVVRDGDEICVRAAAGEQAGKLVGARVPAGSGLAGYVLSAGHPIALSSGTDDARLAEGVPSIIGRTPANVLCVPCLDDDVITGALELIDKAGGSGFTFDDVEFATVLAQVAGVALSSHLEAPTSVPDAAALARELERLQAREPLRYVAVATLLTALLSWR